MEPFSDSRPRPVSAGSNLNARQRKQVYMHSSIFEESGPATYSCYAPKTQEKIYRHIHHDTEQNFKPELDILRPADLKQTQNSGHNAVFPASRNPRQTDELYTPHRKHPFQQTRTQGDEITSMPIVKANHDNSGSIPREQWACPDVFNKTTNEDSRIGWKDTRNELLRQPHRLADQPSAFDLKHHELSSSLFNKERLGAQSARETELQSSDAHFLAEDSSLTKKVDLIPPSAEERLQDNLMASANNCIPGTRQIRAVRDSRTPSPPHRRDGGSLDEPAENPRRRHEKNFSDIFGRPSHSAPKKITQREEATASGNCSWLEQRMEICYRNKNPKAELPKDPHERTKMELESNLDFANGRLERPNGTDLVAVNRQKAEIAKKEREEELRASARASAFSRKQMNLASKQNFAWDSEAPDEHPPYVERQGLDDAVTGTPPPEAPEQGSSWGSIRHSSAPRDLKLLNLGGSGNILC